MSECATCGVLLEAKATGRKPKYCEPCFKKYRVDYQQRYWQKRKPKVHNRRPALVPGLSTHPSKNKIHNLASLVKLREESHAHYKSEFSKALRNAGGSGFSEPLPRNSDHSLYACRLKLAKSKNVLLRLKLDFTQSQQRMLTEPIHGTDPWCWYTYEFGRQLRLRRRPM